MYHYLDKEAVEKAAAARRARARRKLATAEEKSDAAGLMPDAVEDQREGERRVRDRRKRERRSGKERRV